MIKIIDLIKQIESIGLTVEQWESCLQDNIDKVFGRADLDWIEIKNKYGVDLNPDTLRKANGTVFGGAFVAEYFRQKNSISDTDNLEQMKLKYRSESSINKDGSFTSDKLVVIKNEDLKDKNFLLEAHGFDSKEWELISARNNIWNVYSKQDGIQELYSSKIVVKPLTGISLSKVEDFYKDLVKKYEPPTVKNTHESKDGYMLEVPIMDLHLSKLSMSEDVSEPYNFELAKERFNYIIDDVINNTKGMNISKIIFPIGNDFFNCDNANGSTTAGTPQSNELSPQVMFDKGTMLLIDGISKLANIAPVEAFCVSGNHDFLSAFHAICTVWAYFHNDERVTISKDTSPRKYISFGQCLIGFTHGDKEKNRIDGIMQVEAKEKWGNSRFREIHMGHLHSEQVKESNGIILRNLSSVTGSDQWHHNSGYVGAIKKCQSFLWDKEYGLKLILNTVIK